MWYMPYNIRKNKGAVMAEFEVIFYEKERRNDFKERMEKRWSR